MKVLVLTVALCGCSSLVDSPCADGYRYHDGTCIQVEDSVDAPTLTVNVDAPSTGDAPEANDAPPGLVCDAPTVRCGDFCVTLETDPDNCGSCGHICASGICVDSQCLGALPGHIVAIGHDYQDHNPAMIRVLGNSAALGLSHDLGITRLEGTTRSASRVGSVVSLGAGLADLSRLWHEVPLPTAGATPVGIDVFIVHAQIGDGDTAQGLGVQWAPTLDALLARGGVVVFFEGAGGVSHRFAAGAGLISVTPVDATGTPAFVVDPTDAVTRQVVSPYLADTTSVVFPGAIGAIVTPAGPVVVHTTRAN